MLTRLGTLRFKLKRAGQRLQVRQCRRVVEVGSRLHSLQVGPVGHRLHVGRCGAQSLQVGSALLSSWKRSQPSSCWEGWAALLRLREWANVCGLGGAGGRLRIGKVVSNAFTLSRLANAQRCPVEKVGECFKLEILGNSLKSRPTSSNGGEAGQRLQVGRVGLAHRLGVGRVGSTCGRGERVGLTISCWSSCERLHVLDTQPTARSDSGSMSWPL